MKTSQASFLDSYKQQVEEKFPIAVGKERPSQRDFEYLSEQIQEKSGVYISISTLKRIWRKDYQSVPHPSTLNALVSLLAYDNWQAFIQNQGAINSLQNSEGEKVNKNTSPNTLMVGTLIGAGLVLALLVFLGSREKSGKGVKVSAPVFFQGNKTVDLGLPNTLIFEYDLSGVQADSFFFQQSWDEFYREAIDPHGSYHNSIYYYPGFHKAKLIANDSILKIHRVHLRTDGWLPYLKNSTYTHIPRYFAPPKTQNGLFKLDESEIEKSEIDISKDFEITYANMQDFEDLSSQHFFLETALQMDSLFYNPCPEIQIYVHCEVHIFKLAITTKGCVRNLWMKLGENYFFGKDTDLSSMGTNVFDSHRLVLNVADQHAQVFLDDQLVLESAFEADLGEIKGIDFSFTGIGALDYVRLGPEKGNWVFQDEFEPL